MSPRSNQIRKAFSSSEDGIHLGPYDGSTDSPPILRVDSLHFFRIMTKGRKYFHFPKSVPGASDFVSTLQQDKYNEPALEAAANAIGQPTEQYPHVKKPPRAENRTQPGKEKTVYAQLIEIRESVAAIAKIPRSNVQKESIEPEEQYKWTKSLSLRIVGDNDELRRQLNQPVQLPILIPANSSLGRGWIDKYQYPRVWSEIFPYFTSGKINVQPYEKDEDKVATDAIRLNHLEDAMSKKRDDRGRPYNCLDLHDQIGIHIFPHEIDEVNAIRVTDSDCTGRAKKNDPKASDLTFNILSMRDSFTPPHVDAGGYLTYVHMVKGKKVWYLLEKTLPEMDTEAKGLMREGGITMLTEKMDLEWSRVLLTKGDSLSASMPLALASSR